ncbi:MAG: hypothetical protein PGN16_10680 [Sphingomonas phyllosphaerae]|uniref:hypothetical protein n=1 Tax=Sphingomonas phyllosphaerae TaxID=257003 RepID=UPI002FF5D72E
MSRAITFAGLAVLLVLIGLAVLGVRACAREQDAPSSTIDASRDAALVGGAAEGNAITADAMTNAADIAATTKENENAIRSAPGGDTRVPAASNRAALGRLCLRPSYHADPRCAALQRPGAGTAGR